MSVMVNDPHPLQFAGFADLNRRSSPLRRDGLRRWHRPLSTRIPGVIALIALLLAACSMPASAQSEQARVAVAANFTQTAKRLAELYQSQSPHTVKLSFGSTGQLFAQISQAAPIDVFLAADQTHPQKAVADGLAVAGSRFTYAVGRIAIYSTDPDLVSDADVLSSGAFSRIAIANPATAPYGRAAIEFLRNRGLNDSLADRLVKGASIAQTMQFVATGNAELGIVALSQIIGNDEGSRWLVPAELHAPIAQDAVLLNRGADNGAALGFLEFLKSDKAQDIKSEFGYQRSD